MTSFPEQQSNINEKSHAFVLKMEIKIQNCCIKTSFEAKCTDIYAFKYADTFLI